MAAADYNRRRIERGDVPIEVLVDALTGWTGEFQAAHPELEQDSAFGPATERAWREEQSSPATLTPPDAAATGRAGAPPPPPRGHSAIIAHFGAGLTVHEDPAHRGALLPDWAWVRASIRTVTWRGHTLNLHREIAAYAVASLEEAFNASGFMPKKIGTLSMRHIMWDPARPLSTHAVGAAFDLDPAENRYGWPLGRCTLGVGAGLAFARVLEERGFTWGGRWARPDAMHFQYGSP